MKKLDRNSSLDLIRIFATFSVISVHFFMNIGFYQEIVEGKRMYMMVVMRSFFMICVPLFLILTGYLMSEKKLNIKYYGGVCKTIITYFLASLFCIIYKNMVAPDSYDFKRAFFSILNYSAADYSWYIEMYIGLFLIIPFLNLIYGNLNGKKQKQCLLLTLLLLTSLPAVMNIYNFTLEGWWNNPGLSYDYQKIIPSRWTDIWPLTYYFIGCYFREHGLKLRKMTAFVLLIIFAVLNGTFNFYRSYGNIFQWGQYQEWYSLLNVIPSVLTFHIFSDLKLCNECSVQVKALLKKVADLCLGAYLLSYIFDNIFYSRLRTAIPDVTYRLEYYFVIVPIVFVCSLAMSAVVNVIYFFIKKLGLNLLYIKKVD